MNKAESITNKSIIQIFKETLTKNFMNIQGRATRREFNFFLLILSLIIIFLYAYKTILTLNFKPSETINILIFTPFTILICWATIPTIFLIIRRSHDLNISALGILFSILTPAVVIFVLILILKSGTIGFNKYGPNPYETTNNNTNAIVENLKPKQAFYQTNKFKNIPLEEILPNNKTKKTEEPINLLDPNKPIYKV